MYTDCIVPLDGSDFAQVAVSPAAACAQSLGLRLRVIGIAREDAELAWVDDHVRASAHDVSDVKIIVDPNPVDTLLTIGAEPGNLLCFASHDHGPVAAHVMHSVGSELIRRADYPIMVVGPDVLADDAFARDVVVAIDGVHDPRPLVDIASTWSRALGTGLRIVTVYEPVLADLRRPEHFARSHGPATDPEAYLETVRSELAPTATTVAIPDPVSAAAGLHDHLAAHPGRLLVIGGHHHAPKFGTGTVADVLQSAQLPLLLVNHS
jgi:nucleotide-binding universal stress UspA family protein